MEGRELDGDRPVERVGHQPEGGPGRDTRGKRRDQEIDRSGQSRARASRRWIGGGLSTRPRTRQASTPASTPVAIPAAPSTKTPTPAPVRRGQREPPPVQRCSGRHA
jgi:hypothetical protein